MADTVHLALYARLEAKPGKEAEVEKFLNSGLALVQQEPETVSWYAIRMGPTTFAIFDTFANESGRQAHLSGKVAAALKEKGADLFAETPKIEKLDIIASKTGKSSVEKAA
jgi:quinol monooxygenase YgiN